MTRPSRFSLLRPLSALLVLGISPLSAAQGAGPVPEYFPNAAEVGDLGLWMMGPAREYTYAASQHLGRQVRQPVNVIMSDFAARTPEQAAERVAQALGKVGYAPVKNVASGYQVYAGGVWQAQAPAGQAFMKTNPWGGAEVLRLFGPVKVEDGYTYVGNVTAHSRFGQADGPRFTNFMLARESLGQLLDAQTTFRKKGYIDLRSRLDTPTETTADHDGCAIIIVSRS